MNRDRWKVLYIFIPNKSEDDKSEDDKTEYDKNNGKIVSLSLVINFMYVIHINVRIIGFLLSNTFGTALKISQSFFKGSEFSRTWKTQDSLKNDKYQIGCDKISWAVHVSAYYIY